MRKGIKTFKVARFAHLSKIGGGRGNLGSPLVNSPSILSFVFSLFE